MRPERELIREHFTTMFGHCEGFTHVDPRTINDTGMDARIDGVRQYTVQTFRDPDGGIFHFVTIVYANEVKRICLPPDVTALLLSQRDSVVTKAKRAHGRLQAKRNFTPPQKGVVPPQFRTRRKK